MNLFRIPARYSQLLNLALALLAATACAASHRRYGYRGRVATVVAMLLLLAEFYVVNFPSGPPQPYPVPAVYKEIAWLPPGAVLSLPSYANTPLWFREANYQRGSSGSIRYLGCVMPRPRPAKAELEANTLVGLRLLRLFVDE